MESNELIIIEEDGTEKRMEILFTFTSDEFNKSYVLFVDPNDEDRNVFARIYDEEGNLDEITDEAEFDVVEEVFNTFVSQMMSDDEEE